MMIKKSELNRNVRENNINIDMRFLRQILRTNTIENKDMHKNL